MDAVASAGVQFGRLSQFLTDSFARVAAKDLNFKQSAPKMYEFTYAFLLYLT